MTRREEAKMFRLELENRELRTKLDDCMRLFREQLYQVVDLKIKLEMVQLAIGSGE